jgi:hypothetical protein
MWLLPGESREIVVSWPEALRVPGTPRLVADANNADAVTR